MENANRDDDFPKHKGSKALIEKYNINDQAHSDSSAKDFIKTTSEFHHADETERELPDDSNSAE